MPNITITSGENITALTIGLTPTGSERGGDLDVSYLPNLTSLVATAIGLKSVAGIQSNVLLSNIRIDNNQITGTVPNISKITGLVNFYANQNNFTSFDLTGFAPYHRTLQFFVIFNNPSLTGYFPQNTDYITGIRNYSANGTLMTGAIPPLPYYCPRLTTFGFNGARFTGMVPDIYNGIALQNFRCDSNANITGFTGRFPPNLGFNCQVGGNRFNSISIQNILQAAVDANGYNGTLNISGTNMARATGFQNTGNIAILTGRGWTVSFRP